jgi:hypothetical protein
MLIIWEALKDAFSTLMFMLSAAGTERKTNVSDSKKKKKF